MDVAALNERLEGARAEGILRWALDESGLERVAVASSFQAEGTCVLHMAIRIRPDVPVLFLDTGFHFAETLRFKAELTERLGLNVQELHGDPTPETRALGDRPWQRHPDLCCRLNKVIPFTRALHGFDAWITGLRRDSAPTRAGTPIVEAYELEPGRPMIKVNPVAAWTRRDVWAYLRAHDLPRNPLYDRGYAQIGCAPCTRAARPGEHERDGRWDGSLKVECGLHAPERV